MNGVHDLGGTDGLGPVIVEENEPVWHAEWEKAGFGMFPFPFAAGWFNVDMFRFGIEQMHPAHYLLSPYYEHWAHTAEHYGIKAGALDPEEIEKRTRHYLEHPDEPLPDTKNPDLVAFVEGAVKGGVSPRRDSDAAPRFKVGDRVRVRDDSPKGHTRRARYVRGKTGSIEAHYGTFLYPDSVGNGGPDDPTHLYSVRFDGADLWGPDHAEENTTVYFDAWEPYLEPAGTQEGGTR
jgi:nitrile hydratase beta subunit